MFDDPNVPYGDSLTYTVTVTTPIEGLVGQVSQSSYEHIHQDLLYTHSGDNRGLYGPEHDLAQDNIYLINLEAGTFVDSASPDTNSYTPDFDLAGQRHRI